MKMVEYRKKKKEKRKRDKIKHENRRQDQQRIYDSFENVRIQKRTKNEEKIDEEMKRMQREHKERTLKLRQELGIQ